MRLMSRDHQFLCLRSISCAFVGHQLCSRVSTGTSSRVTTYTRRDKTTRSKPKPSHQVQPVPENQPYHNTTYTRCDKTAHFRAKVSRQVQPVRTKPASSPHQLHPTRRDHTFQGKTVASGAARSTKPASFEDEGNGSDAIRQRGNGGFLHFRHVCRLCPSGSKCPPGSKCSPRSSMCAHG